MPSSLAMFTTLIILSFLYLDALGNQGITLPIHRVALPQDDHAEQIMNAQISVYNRNQFVYEVDLGIGNQSFPLVLDTGSSDLWVLSGPCDDADCKYLKTYAPSSSLVVSDAAFELHYLQGSVSGAVACDIVQLGAYQIPCQVFGMANHTQNLHLSTNGNSGIFGLGFPSIATIVTANSASLLSSLFNYLDEDNRFFALALGRVSGNDPTSSFSIGELDPTISDSFQDFFFLPVLKAGADAYDYWKIPLLYITINSTILPLSPSLIPNSPHPIAVLDSGTTLVLGPTIDVKAFWEAIDSTGDVARLNSMSGMWEVRCEKAISVSFAFGSEDNAREFPVHPEDLNWDTGGGEWCMGGVQANDKVNSGDWLFGDVFLRNVYATHHGANSTHQPNIGLLALTDSASALDDFRKTRGPDASPPGLAIATKQRPAASMHSTLVYSLSATGGFFIGALVIIIFRVVQRRKHYYYSCGHTKPTNRL